MNSDKATQSASLASRLRRFLPLLVLLSLILGELWYWQQSVREQQVEREQAFSHAVEHALTLFKGRFAFYQNILYASRGLYNSSAEVSAEEWHAFIQSLRVRENYPGIRGVFYADYRELEGAKLLSSRLHQNQVVELAAASPAERGFAVVVRHFEPQEQLSRMPGYDIAAEAATLQALLSSCKQRDPVMSPVFVQGDSEAFVVRQVMPVFRQGLPLETEVQRHDALLGWVGINYDMQRWLGLFVKEFGSGRFSLAVSDAAQGIFFDSRRIDTAPQLTATHRLTLGRRDWQLRFSSTPEFEKSHQSLSVHLFPLTALLLTLLLWQVVRGLQGGRNRAEQLAMEMTDKLRQSEERYRAMFESNKAVEFLIDPEDGAIVDANQAAVNYYGYRRDELRQMNIADINTLSPHEVHEEIALAEKERRNHFLFKHRHATGEVRDVEVHSGPIEVGGKKLLYSIVHDVTDRMESERALRESEERYHTIIDSTSEGYWLVDVESMHIIEVNDALCRMLGYRSEEMLGRSPFDFADEQSQQIFAYQTECIDALGQRSYEAVLRHKDGQGVTVRINATNMPQTAAGAKKVFAFITDISEWKRTEEQLRIAATFFDTTSEAITVTDADNRIIAVNPAFTQITGYSEADALGRDPAFLSSGRNDAAFYRNMWETLKRIGRWQGEIWNRRKSGELYPEWLSIVAIHDDKDRVKQYMAVFSDITKRKKDEEKIWRQANYDALTGLPNRNLFKDRLNQAMHAARREGGRIALMFIDLDRFKWVNDTLGHAAGDMLLQEAALRLSHSVRDTDTVARLGGDEFTVLLSDMHNTCDVERIAEQLLSRLGEPFDLDGKEAFVSGSIGITLYPGDAEDMEQLLGNADAAMYTAKDAGRNVFRYFTQEMNEAAQRRLRLETDLRRVLEHDELSLHYQPIVEANGHVAGAEALLRWNHPELGNISPNEFIPLAEEVGTITPIEQWVMRQACHDTVRFQQIAGGEFFISVNVSSVQCKSEQCQRVLGDVLEESGLAPNCLKLEITERVMMENTEQMVTLLSDLREMGINLAVDDFGTGYSSLSYLKQFPVDVLKIDRAFVSDLPQDKDDVALVEAIVAMAHSLDLQVVAEGVESGEQLAFLNSLGCDLLQGFYFSKPLSLSQFEAYLSAHNS